MQRPIVEPDDAERCPKCGSDKVVGLVDSFWCDPNVWDSRSANIRLQSETEMGEARMCSDCEHTWDDADTVDGLRRQLDSITTQRDKAMSVCRALLMRDLMANVRRLAREAVAMDA